MYATEFIVRYLVDKPALLALGCRQGRCRRALLFCLDCCRRIQGLAYSATHRAVLLASSPANLLAPQTAPQPVLCAALFVLAAVGHPWRYSEEQLTYHYTRDRNILVKALLRRNLGPASPMVPASGLLDPALQSFHKATMQAHNKGAVRVARLASAADVEVPTPTACAAPSPLTAA